jgi:general secretion pathway protein A
MYEKFYNFSEKPFNVTPDTKFFFPSPKHQEALNSLIYAVEERKGFVVITGEIGAGKTTVSRSLLNRLSLNTKVAVITSTNLSPKELISEILDEFEVEHKGGSKQKLLAYLNSYLIKQLAAGVNVVLIIDEAQNLSTKVMEEVRMLSNLETERDKLIQIILMGQPELRQKLNNPKLEQFRQRIAVYYHLNSLNKEETREYIYHRLSLVNSNGYKEIFSPEAVELIYLNSRGIPRLINLFCDSALLSGFVYEAKVISAKIINEVARERDINSLSGVAEIDKGAQVKTTYCCLKCRNFEKCGLKWDRGMKKEEQLCCVNCQDYNNCTKGKNG